MKAQFAHLLRSLIILAVVPVLGIKAAYSQPITPAADTSTNISHPASNPNQFDIAGGTRAGANLFHSFQQFGLSQGQIANFLSNPDIQNILGRVVGGNPSMINGLLQVTGGNSNLFLMNPTGIIFGPHARLNVPASFVATTANGIGIGSAWLNAIGPNDYFSLTETPNSFAFLGTNPGAILNAGTLKAGQGQSITLLGGTVINTGTIEAPGGAITIAAVPGQQLIRITQAGSLLSLVLPTEAAAAINAPVSSPLSLPALLTGGIPLEATGMSVKNGVVRLTSTGRVIPTEAGAATVSGSLSVAASALPNTPQINVVGDRVSLLNATLNASGSSGGVVRIGGDYQGLGTLPNARFTEVDANTIIRADSTASLINGTGGTGNGGTVIVWSTDMTTLAGTITAEGGLSGGNGGLVETSSQQTLLIAPSASVSTRATQGQQGTWLLDPPDLTVTAGGMATLADASSLTNTPTTATTISAGTIVSGLNGNHVNLQASNSITVNEAIDASANPVVGNLTLTTPTTTLNQPITLAPDSTLSGTASTVNVNPGARIQNGVDVAAAGGTVNVAAGTFYVPGVINQVSITKPVTVKGAGAESTIVDGGGTSRGFYIDPGTNNTVTLDGLTIQNGYVIGSGAGILVNSGTVNVTNSTLSGNSATYGGGIYSGGKSSDLWPFYYYYGGTVNVTSSTLSDNSATYGGGIYNLGGTVNVTNSTLSGNSAGSGGGISNASYAAGDPLMFGAFSAGRATVTNSTLSGNSATNGSGGGISNYNGFLTLRNSTLSGNSAINNGGGIYSDGYKAFFEFPTGSVGITNSTLSGNSATNGGGIYNVITLVNLSNSTLSSNSARSGGGIYSSGIGIYRFGGGTLNVTNSTLSGNSATDSGGGLYNTGVVRVSSSTITNNSANSGGGVFNSALMQNSISTNMFTVRNSIVAGNIASLGRELTNLGSSTSEGYNLFGFNGSSGVEGMVLRATDIVPLVRMAQILAPLGDYGGSTQTHALVPGSPAIDVGDPTLTTPDQRGFPRVDRVDVGAFEFQGGTPPVEIPGVNPPIVTLPIFSLPEISLTELYQITAALYGRQNMSLIVSIQPEPTKPLLCIDRNQGEERQSIDAYHGLPDCPTE